MAYNCPHCQAEIADAMPKEEFGKANSARREAEKARVELETQLAEAVKKAATSDTLAQQIEAMRVEHARAADGWGLERGILSGGISDPEGIDFARMAYERVKPNEQGQKPTINEWLSARDQLPKAVQAYLPAPAGAPPVPQVAPPQLGAPAGRPLVAPVAPPPANAGARPYTSAPSQFSPEAIARMSPQEWAAAKQQIFSGGQGQQN